MNTNISTILCHSQAFRLQVSVDWSPRKALHYVSISGNPPPLIPLDPTDQLDGVMMA